MDPYVEWDPHKALSNLKKHGVSFTEAVASLEDDLALTLEDEHPVETRFISRQERYRTDPGGCVHIPWRVHSHHLGPPGYST